MSSARVMVIGAGSWGTALAVHAAGRDSSTLWSRRPEFAEQLRCTRKNEKYLPKATFPKSLDVTDDLSAVQSAGQVVLAVPTQRLRETLRRTDSSHWQQPILVVACKGIELDTLALPTEILASELGDEAARRAVIFSGPSFADEMAAGQPTAVVAASRDEQSATSVQSRFSHGNVRVYSSTDPVGVQVAAALKNVVAIAAGVADGLGFGHNARAGLITRSLAEMARLGTRMGGDPTTFMGLAGLGDLVLTCTGSQSRNRTVGFRLGQGERLRDILESMPMVAEGVPTARAAKTLADREGVEMPIVEQVEAILFEDKDPRVALGHLLARPLRAES